jgi:AraC family transcriptional regulator
MARQRFCYRHPTPKTPAWQKLLPVRPSDPVRNALRLKSEHGVLGSAAGRLLARGPGWRTEDVVCCSGPQDRPFEERHDSVAVAVVLSGTFTYGNDFGRALLTPGAFLLGDVGGCFTCGHEHGEGDRCLSFHFEPAFFENIAAAAGACRMRFDRNSLPAHRGLAPLAARASVAADYSVPFEELALDVAAAALRGSNDHCPPPISKRDERRVAAVVRYLEERYDQPCALVDLARLAGLSPYHFLRVFRATTGLTPHQHLLRVRLRAAAIGLVRTDVPVTEIALASGFDDLSNFTRSFRAEYGTTPLGYRRACGRRSAARD